MALEFRTSVPRKSLPGFASAVSVTVRPVHRRPGIYLRHGDENPNGMERSHVKEFPGGWVTARRGSGRDSAAGAGARASRNQRAYVSIAGRDDSVERSVHLFERLQFLQPMNVGRIGIHNSLRRLHIAQRLVGLLLRNGVCLQQEFPSGRRRLGEVIVGLCSLKIGAPLLYLSVDFRSIDFREQLPLFHAGPDIEIPLLQIAAGSRINWCIRERLRIARQHEFVCRRPSFRMNHADGQNCRLLSRLDEGGAGLDTLVNAGINHECESAYGSGK